MANVIKIVCFTYIIFLFYSFETIAEEANIGNITLDKLIKEAISNNPELNKAKTIVDTSKIIAKKMGKIKEPKFTLGFLDLPARSPSLTNSDMPVTELSLSQEIPFPGKLSRMKSIGLTESSIMNLEYENLKNILVKNIKKSYFSLYNILKALELTENNKSLLDRFVQIARKKYEVGLVNQTDVLRASVELEKMKNELTMLESEKKIEEARLSYLIYRKDNFIFSKLPDFKKSEISLNFDKIKEEAIKKNPMLLISKENINKQKTNRSLKKLEFLPDFDIGASYGIRSGIIDNTPREDVISFMISFNLPFLWGTKRTELTEAKLEVYTSEFEYKEKENELLFMLKEIIYELEKNKKVLTSYENEILPKAKQTLNSAQINYEVGKIDFLVLLEAQMTLYKHAIDYYKELTNNEIKIAELNVILGYDI
jgi:outer membrane protein TolC